MEYFAAIAKTQELSRLGGKPRKIRDLEAGDTFLCLNQPVPNWKLGGSACAGIVIAPGQLSVRVYWTDNPQLRTKTIVDGPAFVPKDERDSRVQPELEVWCTTELEVEGRTDEEVAAMSEKLVTALKAKYLFNADLFAKAMFAPPRPNELLAEKLQERMAGIEKELVDLGEEMPDVDWEKLQSQYEQQEEKENEMALGKKVVVEDAETGGTATATAQPQASQTKTDKAKQAKAQRAANLESAGTGKAGAKAPRAKKEKVLRPCLDGCGAQVPGNFAMGHDAKLKSLIIKVERGEADIADIPDEAADLIKFKKGELEQVKNDKGVVVEKIQHYICTAAPVKFPGREDVVKTERD